MSGGAIAEAVAGLITGGFDAGINIDQNTRNIHFQRGATRYNKVAALVSMMREDNAVQRRVADLKKAGLSPTLAAGSAAATGPPMKIEPTKTGLDINAQNAIMNMINLKNQTRLINAQIENMGASTARIAQQTKLDLINNPVKLSKIISDTSLKLTQAEFEKLKKDYFEETNQMPDQGGMLGKAFMDWLKAKELINKSRTQYRGSGASTNYEK